MSSPPPRLLDQVKQAIRLKHFSLKTEKSYVHYIRDFILFHNKRHPTEMGADEIRAYLSHLAIERNVAPSTQTVALSALLFLYRQVLHLELPYIDGIERASPFNSQFCDRAWVGRAIVLVNRVLGNQAGLPSGLDDYSTCLKPKGCAWSNLLIDTHSTHDEIDGILTESSTG